MRITEKETYETFKAFKNLYTQINKEDMFLMFEDNKIKFHFSGNLSSFCLLAGELKFTRKKVETKKKSYFIENYFLNWISENEGKVLKLSLENMKLISNILKKDFIGIEMNEEEFSFIYNKNETEEKISFEFVDNSDFEKIKKLTNRNFKEFIIENFMMNEDKLEIVIDNEKIFETVSKRINLTKESELIKLKYSEYETIGDQKSRICIIESENQDLIFRNIYRTI